MARACGDYAHCAARGSAARAGRRRGRFLQFPPSRAGGALPRAVLEQHHRPHARQRGTAHAHVQAALGRARTDVRRRAGVDRHDLLHGTMRPGAGDPGERLGHSEHDARARRSDHRTDPRAATDRGLAAGLVRNCRQRPSQRHAAGRRPAGGRGAARHAGARRRGGQRRGRGRARDARGSEALESARARGRRILDGLEVGSLRQCAGRRTRRGVQCRRGRAGDVQGPGAADAQRRSRVRGHDRVRARRRRAAGLSLPAWRIPASARAVACRARAPAAAQSARHGDPRACGIRFRHRHPPRRRGVRLRRGVGVDRVARGQARHSAQPPALSR